VACIGQPVAKRNASNPLQRDGQELVANVARVVTAAQPMVFYYEVYEPGPAAQVRVLSNIAFYKGSRRVLQTDLVVAQQANVGDRKAVSFEMTVPSGALEPGLYTCQVNVVDDTAGTFAFPRFQLYVRK
jgi:hypothetical protein